MPSNFFVYLIIVPFEAFSSVLFAYLIQPLTQAASNHNSNKFFQYTIVIVIVAIANCILAYITESLNMKLVKGYERDLREYSFNNIILQKPPDFFKLNTNQYLSTLDVDVKMLSQNHFGSILSIYKVIWSFIISAFAVSYIDWKVAVLVIVFSLVSVTMPKLFNKSLNKNTMLYSSAFSKLLENIKGALDGFTVLKTFRVQKQAIVNVSEYNNIATKRDVEKETTFNRIGYLSMAFSIFTFLGVIILGSIMVLNGEMVIGTILALSQMIGGIIAPFEGLPKHIARVKSTNELYKKIDNIPNNELIEANNLVIKNNENCFKFKEVFFCYNTENNTNNELFKNLNIEFDASKKYIIVGKSGSGKSTLAKLLMKFYAPTKGEICWNNQDITTIDDEQYYSLLAYQQQEVFLFDDTLKFNITLGRKYSNERLEEVIANCGLSDVVANLENGIDTVVHENGNILSGGERQRVGIARCMLENPKMIIFDESFANLDNTLALQIEELIITMRNCGCIIITHHFHPTIFEKCDFIICMDKGKIIEKGSFYELNNKGTAFYNLMHKPEIK